MSASTLKPSEPVRFVDYRPLGAVRDAFLCRAPEWVLSGPAGTGKTRGALELLHLLALKYAGSRSLITRRERNSLTQTALVTFDCQVKPALDGVVWRATEQEYRYPNGSVVVVGGLDREGQKVFSGQYDHVYVNEATELEEAHWENLTTRLRNGKSPRPQLLGDCNPDRPTHWLKKRCEVGRCVMLESRHEDNPTLWDARAGDWTAEGRRYVLGVLEALTGPRKLRLRHGRWVRAEGVVYEAWDRAVHLIDPFAIPDSWPRVWSVDFGFTNAFCCLCGALDGDGRLFIYRQIYHTKRRVDEHAERMKQIANRFGRPAVTVADPEDREGRETLAAAGFGTVAAVKHGGAKMVGIQLVQRRLAPAGDGRARLFVFRDSLDERDQDLADAKKPTCGEEEFDGYVWNDAKRKDEPVDADNHFLDACRYLVFQLDAPRETHDDEGGATVYTT